MDIDKPPGRLARLAYRSPIWVYRIGLGRLMGDRLLMLTHIGRKSGEPRYAVLEVVRWDRDRDAFVVPAAYGSNADWYRNLSATPEAEVNHRGRKVDVVATLLPIESAADEFATYADAHPKAAANLGRLMGVAFDDPATIAARVPLVELRVL